MNFWLVLYTWLQHTDVDVPHLDAAAWTWEKGAFLSIDRPYGAVLDFLHHRIGGAVQLDPGFSHLTPRLLSTLETKI